MNKIEKRQLKRDGICRVCDKIIKRDNEDVVTWYTRANRGQFIHICLPCCEFIGNLAKQG